MDVQCTIQMRDHDVMGDRVKVSTKCIKTCKQVRSHTRKLHKHTFSCMHVFSPISAHFHPHYIIMVKGLFNSLSFVSFKCPTTLFQLPSLCVRGWYSPYISNIYTISRCYLNKHNSYTKVTSSKPRARSE